MRFNIRNKFLVPMVILVLLGMGGSSIISYTISKKSLKTALTGQISQIADSTEVVMRAWVRDRTLDVANWGIQHIQHGTEGFLCRQSRQEVRQRTTRRHERGLPIL